jgi:YggT family protein
MNTVSIIIQLFFRLISLIIIIDVILSFFMPPFNPIRLFFDRLTNPFLNPIRRLIPAAYNFDFSALILLLLLQGLEFILLQVFK